MYAKTLIGKAKEHNAKVYLVNTGWNGTGKRISLKNTRAIIDAIIDGSIENAPTTHIPILNLVAPTALNNVDTEILDPRNTYADVAEWETKAKSLSPNTSRTSNSTATTTMQKHWLLQGPIIVRTSSLNPPQGDFKNPAVMEVGFFMYVNWNC